VALVTGASSGIGKEAARAFVAAGFEVIGTGRKTSGLTPPAGVTYLDLDVASDDSATAAVAEVINRFGRIDVLVNNAGIGSAGAVEENSVAQAQNVLNINVLGVIRMTKAVLPHMRAQGGGRVINAAQPDTPLPLYAERRRVFDEVIADAMKAGDDPAVVAKVIVTAATDKKPKLRYTAGPLASRVTTARRLVPAGAFDKQIRKNNRMPG
jgi:nucleoside-diphosphate-sugar epimerase